MSDTESERRSILQAVADGTLNPAEAAERLAALDDAEGAAAAGGAVDPIRRVHIISTGHPVRVVADARRSEPLVDGPHTSRREGDTLVIQAELEDAGDFFIASVPPLHHRVDPMQRIWRWAPPLVVRMAPDLALEVDVTASSLAVRDIKGPISMHLSAGSASLGGFASPIDIDVSAGSVKASGVLDRGQSSVRCSAGSVKLHLARGSSVRMKGTANAGRLGLPYRHRSGAGARAGARRGAKSPFGPFGPFGEEHESVVGDGAGLLDIEVTTGSVVVRSDNDDRA